MKVIPNTRNENIKRLNQIYSVLKKNDFEYLIEENTFFKKFPFLRNYKAEKENEFPDESIPLRIRKSVRGTWVCLYQIRTDVKHKA